MSGESQSLEMRLARRKPRHTSPPPMGTNKGIQKPLAGFIVKKEELASTPECPTIAAANPFAKIRGPNMPYDPGLAERLHAVVAGAVMMEKKMFGSIGWMLNGNMCVGVYKDFLIIRVGEEKANALSAEDGVSPMDITGKPMKGWLKVVPDGYEDDATLKLYTKAAIDFVKTLPAKA